jgi:site-specific DNA recombinase
MIMLPHCVSNNGPVRAAMYARVSSDKQAQAGTIDSQIAAIMERIRTDGLSIEDEARFIDDGYIGKTLDRPALERLRDAAAAGVIDRLYVLCPDRLARRYAHQMLLVDEFQRCGVELVFINRELGKTPEDNMLLQMQGMVAEYEREKIMERCRRGRLHAARQGRVSVLGKAPYGYRYVSAREAGVAQYNVHLPEAAVVQQIFQWVGAERMSMGQVCRRLEEQQIPTAKGNRRWDRVSVWSILKNPAYKGQAAFGKTRRGPMRPRLRSGRNGREQSRDGQSIYATPPEQWISIAVPAVVDSDLFDAVGDQLEENRKRSREGRRGARHLLQGLLVCKCCGYSYYGKACTGKKHRHYHDYYRCTGSDGYRLDGVAKCSNKPMRQDRLDRTVWDDVRSLLADPKRIESELQRRLDPDNNGSKTQLHQKLVAQIDKTRRGITRIIDAYGDGLLDKTEFEPRIRTTRQQLHKLEDQLKVSLDEQADIREMRLVIDNLAQFSQRVTSGLNEADWETRRQIIRTLVKRIEVDVEQVKVVYRVDIRPFEPSPERGARHYCCQRINETECCARE